MENKLSELVIDALPHYNKPINIDAEICRTKVISIKTLFCDFTAEDFKSVFFLLMDYVELDNFLNLCKKEKSFLMQEFVSIYNKLDSYDILIELCGTMKKYNKLRLLGTCYCIFKSQERRFNHISGLWKMFYSLCEELSDDDLETLKEKVPDNVRGTIVTAEDWFCWSLKNNKISKIDFTSLEKLFSNYSTCLKIIREFQVKINLYDIRTPKHSAKCGVALIFNYDRFSERSKLPMREGSNHDVNSLLNLWETFGFNTEVFTNLSYKETFDKLLHVASVDHSKYDLFICCILSHGESNSVYSSDGKVIPIPNIIASITNNCKSLHSKPKLFFIQACQGRNIHQGVGKSVYTLDKDIDIKTYNLSMPPIASDTLRAMATIDGYVSFRIPETGSLFIQTLADLIMKYGDKISILDVMTKVTEEVNERIASKINCFGPDGPRNPQQIVECTNTFRKTLILKKCSN